MWLNSNISYSSMYTLTHLHWATPKYFLSCCSCYTILSTLTIIYLANRIYSKYFSRSTSSVSRKTKTSSLFIIWVNRKTRFMKWLHCENKSIPPKLISKYLISLTTSLSSTPSSFGEETKTSKSNSTRPSL